MINERDVEVSSLCQSSAFDSKDLFFKPDIQLYMSRMLIDAKFVKIPTYWWAGGGACRLTLK